MADNIDELISRIEEQIDSGRGIGRSKLINTEVLQELLEQLRANLPAVIERAKSVVSERASIIEEANRKAGEIIDVGKQQSKQMEAHTNERVQELIFRAKETIALRHAEGEQIVAEAKEHAAQLVEESAVMQTAKEQAQDILAQAHVAAEEIEQDGRQQAETVLEQAQAYSNSIRRQSEQWFLQYAADVRAQTDALLNEAEARLVTCVTDFRELRGRMTEALDRAVEAPAFNPDSGEQD
jgi:hypothetical protein